MALRFVLEAAVLLASVLTPSLRAISTVKIEQHKLEVQIASQAFSLRF